ncbi:MAG TPA: T9SS type A sorting domain-containing protein, partial [Flavobacteriales bacterium]|nr:T9SS type A sorting domain-containing protein [Flavobacteriales bacterium]
TGWSNVSNPASGSVDLYSVSFSSSSNGFMTGESSKVYQWDGSSWNEHSTSLPDNSFHVYSVWTVSNSLAYAACSAGFGGGGYILKYNGSTWTTDYNYTGMGTELFTGICFPSAGKGYAVANSGIIKTKGTASGKDDLNALENTLNVYPNPFDKQINIQYELKEAGMVNLVLYDVSGKQVNSLLNHYRSTGMHEWTLDVSGLNSGVYVVKMEVNGQSGTIKVVK